MGGKQKTLAILAGTVLAAGLTSPAFGSTTAHSPALRTAATGSGMSVVEWNRELITILGDPKAQPSTVQPTRSFALLQAAEYDAVVSITRVAPPTCSRCRRQEALVRMPQRTRQPTMCWSPCTRPSAQAWTSG